MISRRHDLPNRSEAKLRISAVVASCGVGSEALTCAGVDGSDVGMALMEEEKVTKRTAMYERPKDFIVDKYEFTEVAF